MKKNRISQNSAEKPKLPVSKKFYAYISERITATCLIAALPQPSLSESMAVIDAYLTEGATPSEKGTSKVVLTIFTLLRAEIDRAAKRSASARQRAARRRAERDEQTEQTEQAEVTTEPSQKIGAKTAEAVSETKEAETAPANKTTTVIYDISRSTTPRLTVMNRSQRRQLLRENKRTAKSCNDIKEGHPSAQIIVQKGVPYKKANRLY